VVVCVAAGCGGHLRPSLQAHVSCRTWGRARAGCAAAASAAGALGPGLFVCVCVCVCVCVFGVRLWQRAIAAVV
jgi:hypothetical protein